jgi:hypothetical protein
MLCYALTTQEQEAVNASVIGRSQIAPSGHTRVNFLDPQIAMILPGLYKKTL